MRSISLAFSGLLLAGALLLPGSADAARPISCPDVLFPGGADPAADLPPQSALISRPSSGKIPALEARGGEDRVHPAACVTRDQPTSVAGLPDRQRGAPVVVSRTPLLLRACAGAD